MSQEMYETFIQLWFNPNVSVYLMSLRKRMLNV